MEERAEAVSCYSLYGKGHTFLPGLPIAIFWAEIPQIYKKDSRFLFLVGTPVIEKLGAPLETHSVITKELRPV